MREIKFRAWLSGDWYEGNPQMIEWDPEMFSDMSPVTGWGNGFPLPDQTEVILMQYTGLKDEKGNEIYEEDILQGFIPNVRYKVIFSNGAFWIEGIGDWHEIELANARVVEVIGNVFENEDLLELTKKED